MKQPSTPFPAAAAGRPSPPTGDGNTALRPAQGCSRRTTPGPYKDDSDICYYHTTYGDRAMKCKPGCQWVPGNEAAAEN